MHSSNVYLEESLLLTQRIDYSGGTLPVYIGYAPPGSRESDDRWMIHKLAYDSNNNMTEKLFADGSKAFNKQWASRLEYDYV